MTAAKLLPLLLAALLIAFLGATMVVRPSLIAGQTSTGNTNTTVSSSSSVSTTVFTSSTTTVISPSQTNGILNVSVDIGPTRPVCMVNSTTGPAPAYSSVELLITPPSGKAFEVPLNWFSNGCEAFTSAQLSLAPGSYVLNLTNCNFIGCNSALPRDFAITKGRTTTIQLSIDTGIR